MHEGAFALIDCLGFKGIWKRINDDGVLLDKLRCIVKQVQPQLIAGVPFELLRRKWIISASLLSDSVAISLRYDDEDDRRKGRPERKTKEREKSYLVWLLAASTVKILDLFLENQPNLLLRGCITYGEHEQEGNFIVGPAVDYAADNLEVAQGAFVWLHPTAAPKYERAVRAVVNTINILRESRKDEELLRGSQKALAQPIIVEPYNMPLKAGGFYRCPILNPLAFHKTEEARTAVMQAYSDSMSGYEFDIILKHQYTMDFLRAAETAREEYLKKYEKFID